MQMFPNFKRGMLDDEQPQHSVGISRPFFLGRCPVTQGEYQAVTGKNPSHFTGSDRLPVECVSWFDAVSFCNRLSELENRKPYYRIGWTQVTALGGDGYRLPTEAEWEYVCRGKCFSIYPFGDDARALGEYAWWKANSDGKTHPVGQKKPNECGLHDMLGNVWEWCWDGYGEEYYASSPPADPAGSGEASYRMFRGGSWNGTSGCCRSAYRNRRKPFRRASDLGFRPAVGQSGGCPQVDAGAEAGVERVRTGNGPSQAVPEQSRG
jgi:formylglycine-generating enzyme required for sulfatase activity